MMSVTKSFAGLIALMAVDDGLLDEKAQVVDVVPELAAASAFTAATIGQVLDMTNSMDFSEDYADPTSSIVRYGRVLGWLDAEPGDDAAGLYDFLATLQKDPDRDHGAVFRYQTPRPTWSTGSPTGRPARRFRTSCPQRCGPDSEPRPRPTSCWTAAAHW